MNRNLDYTTKNLDIKPFILSQFRMPLISESYLKANDLPIPKIVYDSASNLINLKKISQDEYNLMVNNLTQFLKLNKDKLVELKEKFFLGKTPFTNRIGIIESKYQEQVLNYVSINNKSLNEMIENAVYNSYHLSENLELVLI